MTVANFGMPLFFSSSTILLRSVHFFHSINSKKSLFTTLNFWTDGRSSHSSTVSFHSVLCTSTNFWIFWNKWKECLMSCVYVCVAFLKIRWIPIRSRRRSSNLAISEQTCFRLYIPYHGKEIQSRWTSPCWWRGRRERNFAWINEVTELRPWGLHGIHST